MSAMLRILLIVAIVLPVIFLAGIPSLSPAWLRSELGGVPTVIWLTTAWFAILTFAAWLPQGGQRRR